jgi:hypothetical protein
MFNKKSFLFGFVFFASYTIINDRNKWLTLEKGFKELLRVQRKISDSE